VRVRRPFPVYDLRMGRLALVAALAMVPAGATAAASSLEPPVISEPFAKSVLPCPAQPKSTLDLVGCGEHKILASDAAIDRRARTIFFLLQGRATRGRFVRGERAWLAYRRAVCASRADVYVGGSAAQVVFVDCEVELNAAHLGDLTRFERRLRHH
jgi:uncharacterized protein YecT (DUF1311 family)